MKGAALGISVFCVVVMIFQGISFSRIPPDTLRAGPSNPQYPKEMPDPLSQSEEIFGTDSASADTRQAFRQNSPSEVTQTSQFPAMRLEPVFSRMAVGFGLAGLSKLNAEPMAYHFFLGRHWGFPPWNAFRVWADAISDFDQGRFISINIGGNLYTHRYDTSPYFSLGSGFGYAEGRRESAAGFNLSAAVGVALFRESKRQVELELENKWLFGKLRQGFPSVALVRLGILF